MIWETLRLALLARVTPLVEQYDLSDRLYYPLYSACEELGVPVSINVGVPGPQVRSRCQDPVLLEDVLMPSLHDLSKYGPADIADLPGETKATLAADQQKEHAQSAQLAADRGKAAR